MATQAISSHGTKVKVGDGADPEVFAAIGEVLDITGPGQTLNTEDATNHDSGGWREPIPTILEGGEVTFDINYYGDATQAAVLADIKARTKRNFEIEYPDTSKDVFSGYFTSFSKSAPVEGILRASVTIMISGPVTETPAA